MEDKIRLIGSHIHENNKNYLELTKSQLEQQLKPDIGKIREGDEVWVKVKYSSHNKTDMRVKNEDGVGMWISNNNLIAHFKQEQPQLIRCKCNGKADKHGFCTVCHERKEQPQLKCLCLAFQGSNEKCPVHHGSPKDKSEPVKPVYKTDGKIYAIPAKQMSEEEEEIYEKVFQELSPYADAAWRKDNFRFDERAIKVFSKNIAKALVGKLSTKPSVEKLKRIGELASVASPSVRLLKINELVRQVNRLSQHSAQGRG